MNTCLAGFVWTEDEVLFDQTDNFGTAVAMTNLSGKTAKRTL